MRSASLGSGKRYLRSKREGRLERPGSRRSRWLVLATCGGWLEGGFWGRKRIGRRKEEVRGIGYHEDAVVVLEAVDFVEEIAASAGGDDCVDVFKDEHAGGHVAR